MRFSILASIALVAAPALVSAAGTLGFALGTKNADGSCKGQSDYESDFDAISSASGSKLVRGYSASDCKSAASIMPAAQSKGFQVVLGIWPDVQESFDADLSAITAVAPKYANSIYGVTCGSETLYRGNFTGEVLADKIKTVKTALKGVTSTPIKVGTADSWNKFADGTGDAVVSVADMIFVNAFAFWQAQGLDNATKTYFDDIMQAFGHIQTVAGGPDKAPELWNGETGWPTDGGTDYGAAKAGTTNAKTYYQSAICGMLAWGVNLFYFEAFDEPWKPASIGDNGKPADETHWGAMDANRGSKFSLKC
ncbi:glucan 1,3-beta-glucosidase-like protein [Mytilinidion resinicola]|uniref:glucan 1,3-beta-glucosidase n=1 Tax=Mytilinidion resinicola TaxID=574789 RepID=A0A6A6YXA3_9PEZI|nr:glucan 1,3-beta-glucosidase-like protein [Mytilinidion resinicola]KAF2813410.1 glucan 1,3-beta-glucosidase-like protein [Mytilinidion resinicola]